MTDTLAYFNINYESKIGASVIIFCNLLWEKYAGTFVPFQSSLKLESRAGAYPKGASFVEKVK